MRDFVRSPGRLRSLPLPARAVYTVFLLFTLAALALTAWLTDAMVGLDVSGAREYYAGIDSRPASPAAASKEDPGGPALELPDELLEAPKPEPMAARKLLEVTHFHLFSMPVYLVILAHLFMLSRWGEREKLFWISVATLATAGHIVAPWVARSGTGLSVIVFAVTGAGLALSYLVMSLVPLWEMWAPRPPKQA